MVLYFSHLINRINESLSDTSAKSGFVRVCVVMLIGILSSGCFTSHALSKSEEMPFTLVIDAGHGGKDHGAIDNGVKEKDINLGVALKLAKMVKNNLKNVKVVMTRDDDTFITLQQRADIANNNKGNLFVSIHTNSVDKSNKNRKSVAGSSVYTLGLHKDENNMKVAQRENSVIELEKDYTQKYSGFDPSKDESYIIFEMAQKKNLMQSIRFADEAQKNLVKTAERQNRGVHQAGFWVLWATSMPSVLVELDFICNPASAQYMGSEKGQKKLAEALYKSVENYVDAYRRSQINLQSSTGSVNNISRQTPEITETSDKPEIEAANADRTVVKSTERRRRSSDSRRRSVAVDYESATIPSPETTHLLSKTGVAAEVTEKLADEDKSKADKNNKKSSKKEDKKRRPNPDHKAKREKFETVYKIQLLASKENLSKDNPAFCGLSPVSSFRENNLYKYTYGESTKKSDIDDLLTTVRKKIPDAFIIETTRSKK